MAVPERIKRVIWLRSGGRCAICRDILYESEAGPLAHFLGDVAHIVAERDDGPRGAAELTPAERNAEPNLLLLCLPHHRMVDEDETTFTREKLLFVKTEHERWVAECLTINPVWDTKLFHLYYLNVPRLSLLAALKGASLDLSGYGEFSSLHELGWELNGLLIGFKRLLQAVQLQAMDLVSALALPDPRGIGWSPY